jgi:hypothetical protein
MNITYVIFIATLARSAEVKNNSLPRVKEPVDRSLIANNY